MQLIQESLLPQTREFAISLLANEAAGGSTDSAEELEGWLWLSNVAVDAMPGLVPSGSRLWFEVVGGLLVHAVDPLDVDYTAASRTMQLADVTSVRLLRAVAEVDEAGVGAASYRPIWFELIGTDGRTWTLAAESADVAAGWVDRLTILCNEARAGSSLTPQRHTSAKRSGADGWRRARVKSALLIKGSAHSIRPPVPVQQSEPSEHAPLGRTVSEGLTQLFGADMVQSADALKTAQAYARSKLAVDLRTGQLHSVWQRPRRFMTEWGLGVLYYMKLMRMFCLVLFAAMLLGIPSAVVSAQGQQKQWGFVTRWSLGNACVLSSDHLCNASVLERRYTERTDLQSLCNATRDSLGQDTLAGDYNPDHVEDGLRRVRVLLEPLRVALAHVNVSAELLPPVSDAAACAIALCDGRGSVPTWIGFFDALITLLFAAHWLYTRKALLLLKRKFDHRSFSTADFTVLVSGLPSDCTDEAVLKEYFELYGAVRHVTIGLANRKLLALLDAITVAEAELHHVALERKLLADAAENTKKQTSKMRARLASLCAAETHGAAKLKALQAALRPQAAVRYASSGYAFVTFDEQSCAKALVQRSRSIAFAPAQLGARAVAHTLRCSRPVAPDEYRWENFEFSKASRLSRALGTSAINMLMIALSCISIHYIAKLQRDWGKMGFFMSIAGTFAGLVPIIGSNVIIFITVPLLSNKFEKWHTTAEYELYILYRLLFFQVGNTALAALMYALETPTSTVCNRWRMDGWWTRMGPLHVLNAIFGDIVFILGIIDGYKVDVRLVMRKLVAKRALSQQELNAAWEPPQFSESFRYQLGLKALVCALIFGPANLLVYGVGAVYFFCSYWMDKYNLLRLFATRAASDSAVGAGIVRLIYPLAIVAHCVWAAIFYAHADPTSHAPYFPLAMGGLVLGVWIVLESLWAEHSAAETAGGDTHSTLASAGAWLRAWLCGTGFPRKPSTVRFSECHGLALYLSPLMQRALRHARQQTNRQIEQPRKKPGKARPEARRHGIDLTARRPSFLARKPAPATL